MYVCVGGGERGREKERESVCVGVDGFVVEYLPLPFLYTLRVGLMIRLGALQIFIYITLVSWLVL